MKDTITMKKGTLYGIGIGPGDPELLTIKAVKALGQADVVFVPKSAEQSSTALAITKPYLKADTLIEELEFPMSRDINVRLESRKINAIAIAGRLNAGQNAVFLTLGDPMLYSTYSYVLEHLKDSHPVETIPGIYSFSAISSLLSSPLCKGNESLMVIASFNEEAFRISDTVVCMKVSSYQSQLKDYLHAHPNHEFVLVTDAGKADQQVFTSAECLNARLPYFSTAIIKRTPCNEPR